MSGNLRDFARAAVESNRIRFGDVRRLQRDILPSRITTREEAEVLIALDGVIEKADRDWRDYLIRTVRDFAVWGLRPVGRVDREKAEWLIVTLSSGVARKTARIIVREIVRAATQVDDALLVWAARPGRISTQQGPKRNVARGDADAIDWLRCRGVTPEERAIEAAAQMARPAPGGWTGTAGDGS
jgi:hypothetical protein